MNIGEEKKKAEENFATIKDQIEKSTVHSRSIFTVYLMFLVYIAIIVWSTDHMMLFMPDSKVTLPLLNVELPVVGFYIVSPFLVLVMHFYMLVNLHMHSKKLYKWIKEIKDRDLEKDDILVFPFMFNYSIHKHVESTGNPFKLVFFITVWLLFSYLPSWLLFSYSYYGQLFFISFICYIFYILDSIIYKYQEAKLESLLLSGKVTGIFILSIILIMLYSNLSFFLWVFIVVIFFYAVYDNPVSNVIKYITTLILCLIVWVLFLIFPFGLLNFIAIRFLPYHDVSITLWHKWAIYIDVAVLILFWIDIIHTNKIEIYKPKSPEFGFLKYFRIKINHYGPYFLGIIVLVTLIIYSYGIITVPKDNNEPFPNFFAGKNMYDIIPDNLTFPKFLGGGNINDITTKYPKFSKFFGGGNISEVITRNLELTEKELVLAPPSDIIVQTYSSANKTKEQAWRDYGKGLNLRGRDLRFANFYKSNLRKADLRSSGGKNATLEGANLTGINLSYAKMKGANLQAANLFDANLQAADLRSANLQAADLRYANLQAADLFGANLQAADLGYANLQAADLGYANLQAADLISANLQAAYLGYANLHGVDDLSGENLNDIYFENISLKNPYPNCQVFSKEEVKNINMLLKSNWRKKNFQKQIDYAQKKCKKFDKKKREKLLSDLSAANDFNGFLDARKELVCNSSYDIAESIYYQSISDIVFEALDNHLKADCETRWKKLNEQ